MASSYNPTNQRPSNNSKKEQSYKAKICETLNKILNERTMSPADLARKSQVSKATISRLTNYRGTGTEILPNEKTAYSVALTLWRTEKERKMIYHTLRPQAAIKSEAFRKGMPIVDVNIQLYNMGLPTLNND